jgi:hypothetical protein
MKALILSADRFEDSELLVLGCIQEGASQRSRFTVRDWLGMACSCWNQVP